MVGVWLRSTTNFNRSRQELQKIYIVCCGRMNQSKVMKGGSAKIFILHTDRIFCYLPSRRSSTKSQAKHHSIFFRNLKNVLQHKSPTPNTFTSPPLLAYRRDTNFRQMLIRRFLNLKSTGIHPCGDSLCCTCEHTSPYDTISGSNSTFRIQEHFICLCFMFWY